MKIGFVVNDVRTEEAGFTTTRLGVAATNRGHEAWTISVGDLAYDHWQYRAQPYTAHPSIPCINAPDR